MTELDLSTAIEELLVARNPRHMQVARAALDPGYYLRAAQFLQGSPARSRYRMSRPQVRE